MFVFARSGWKYFDKNQKRFLNTDSIEFNEKVFNRSLTFVSLNKEQTRSFLPVFSGSKILCVGRNYVKHAAELGNKVPERPLWFSKPPSAIIGPDEKIQIPSDIGRVDYEGEVCLLIGRKCKNVSEKEAEKVIGGVTIGLDITARDLQKSDGQWTRAKGFDTFLPLANCAAPYSDAWKKAILIVRLNKIVVQESSLENMVFGFARLVSDISQCMTLNPGDLIMTGTPDGVGPIKDKDLIEIELSGPCQLRFAISCEGHNA
jgi:2-keto-4-pentenoate hydratase/2-oxohepta-3-ene-1,7-dioic acid hydratase in catechol pathway